MPFKLFGGNTVECRACHEQISTDASQCPHCGEPLTSFKLFGGNTVECRACHEQVSTDASECPHCSEQLTSFKLFGGNTIKCRACHEEVSSDASVCPHCNESLTSFKLFGGNTIKCRACHEEVSSDASVCPHCNESLTSFKLFGGNTIKCRACHEEVSSDASVCPHCNESLTSFKLFGGSTTECRACHQQVSTDANECPYCGELFKVNYNSQHVLKEYQSEARNENIDADPNGWIIKLLFYGALIVAAIWLAFAVALPLVIINTALICLIAGLIYKNSQTYLFLLSFLGAIFIVSDYNKGWLTKTLVDNVSFFSGFIQFFLYLNLVSGLIACYFLARNIINERNPPIEKEEFSKRNLIIIAVVTVMGGATVGAQRYFNPSPSFNNQNQGNNIVSYQKNPVILATNNEKMDSAKMDSAKVDVSSSLNGVYPQSSSRLLMPQDLSNLSKRELKIMRNEIFARHGYIFKTTDMKLYFSQQSWYQPLFSDVNNQLTVVEKNNVELIKSYEK